MAITDRPFVKAEALGNDFIIIRKNGQTDITDEEAIALCNRRTGIGADGVLLVGRSAIADISMKVINADGSIAEMCGNGIRCVAKYVFDSGITGGKNIKIETGAGVLDVDIKSGPDGKAAIMRVELGTPVFGIKEKKVEGASGKLITTVKIGNPHAVIFVEDAEKAPVDTLGPVIENLPVFPNRTNVEFVQVINKKNLRMRVWERGAGETQACGTGAAAALAAAAETGRTDRSATVKLDGGELKVSWPLGGQVSIEGGANIVFSGILGGI